MARMAPEEFAKKIGSGLLSFPVTHFTEEFAFDEGPYREHIEWLLKHDPAGLFAAGGTGEFFSLTMPEFAQRCFGRRAADERPGARSRRLRIRHRDRQSSLRRRRRLPARMGMLLLPPYLVNAEPAGLMAHVEAVCASTELGVIFYNRDNAILNESAMERLCERCPNLVGFKDGYGDIELMTRIYARLGDRLTYIGGLPTAETFALPYLEMGVTTYSSAIFNFLPEFAQAFYSGSTQARPRGGLQAVFANLCCRTSKSATGERVTRFRS